MAHGSEVIGYAYNADTWCPSCYNEHAPLDLLKQRDPASPIFDNCASDTPMHCCHCHEFLGGELTDAGVRYVIEALESYINNGHGDPPTLDTWASELNDYSLDDGDKQTLAVFEGIRNFQQNKQLKYYTQLLRESSNQDLIPKLYKTTSSALITVFDTSAIGARILCESHARGRTPHRFPL